MLTSNGNMDPEKKLKAFWGVAQGAVTIICILVGGTSVLKILQTTSIVAAFPYMLIMIAMCVSIYKTLRKDAIDEGLMKEKETAPAKEAEKAN
jgi:choline/glycine/proline betaine transport protein